MKETKEKIKRSMETKFAKEIFFPLSIIFVLLLATLIVTVTGTFGNDVRQSVIEEKYEQLSYVEKNISKRITELKSIFYSIGEDNTFYVGNNPQATKTGYQLVENLERYMSGNEFVSYLVYYQLSNAEKFYSSTGEMEVDVFLRATLKCSKENTLQMMDKIKSTVGIKYYPMSFKTKPYEYLMVVDSFPRFSQNPQAYIVAFVENNALQGIVDALFMNCYGEFVILSEDKNIIYRDGNLNDKLWEELSDQYWTKDVPTNRLIKISGEEYLLQEIYNDDIGWYYISIIRTSELMEEVNSNHVIWCVSVAMMLILSAIAIMGWVLKKYMPINQLAITVKEKLEIPGEKNRDFDEQKLLTTTFFSLLEDNKNRYRDIFFTNLLANQYDENTIVYAMQEHDVSFRYPYYMTLVIYLGDQSQSKCSRDEICAGVKAWLGQSDAISHVVLQKSLECITIFFNYVNKDIGLFEEHRLAEELHSFIKTECDIDSYIGIGTSYLSPLQWETSYREAYDAVYCCRMTEGNDYMWYSEIEKLSAMENFLDYHVSLVDACKKGDVEEATGLMQSLRAYYIERKIREEQIKYLFYNVFSGMLEYVEEVETTEKLKNILFRLLENKDRFVTFWDEVENLYLSIVSQQKEVKDVQKGKLLEKIMEALNIQLFDQMLSVESLADYCGITPSYLNRYFKQQMGCTPMTYVENARMELVRQRLKETDIPIKNIIEEVGYVDQSNFIRKFKRIEGITPVAYRKLHRNE